MANFSIAHNVLLTLSQLISALSILSTVLALPTAMASEAAEDATPSVVGRQSCYATCGTTCYTQLTVNKALNEGYNDYVNGDTPHGYPHTYYDRDGFDLLVDGPYLEFPILHSYRAYTGGAPGPDRVVFNTNGDYAGSITHTGASGNNFVQCS